MKFVLVLLCGLLGACDAPRPLGAWTPKYPDAGPAPVAGQFEDDSDDQGGASADDDDDDSTPMMRTDAGMKPVKDAGPPVVVDPKSPFAKIAGRYLVRMDSYSTVDATQGSNKFHVENRVSNLMLFNLRVDGDKLVADEKMCDQVYQHVCGTGCANWSTVLDKALRNSFFPQTSVTREYKVEGDTLVAGESTMTLGYDAENADSSTPVPTSPSDKAVWKLDGVAATNPDPNRVGVLTQIKAELKSSGGLMFPFNCNVSTAQRLTTSFSIPDIDLSDPGTLTGAYHKVDSDLSKLSTLVTQLVKPSSTFTQDLCTKEKFAAQTAPDEVTGIVFMRADDLPGCPLTADFEDRFPGLASRPAALK